MGYLICVKCKSYYKLQKGERAKDFVDYCACGGQLKYVENLDIVDLQWKPVFISKKITRMEILKKKIQSLRSIPEKLKAHLFRFWNNFRGRFQRPSYGNTYYNSPYGRGLGLESIKNELNLDNIQWTVVIPVALAVTIIYAFTPNIFTLLIFVLLTLVGYLFKDRLLGIKNALITGALSFFLGGLLTGSFLFLIPLTLVGVINGAVCGWIGGYLKTFRY
jgi:hypothetical protein